MSIFITVDDDQQVRTYPDKLTFLSKVADYAFEFEYSIMTALEMMEIKRMYTATEQDIYDTEDEADKILQEIKKKAKEQEQHNESLRYPGC